MEEMFIHLQNISVKSMDLTINENSGKYNSEYELRVLHNSSQQQQLHATGLIAHALPLIIIISCCRHSLFVCVCMYLWVCRSIPPSSPIIIQK